MSTFTLRGRLGPGEKKSLVVDDGRFNHGMIVKEFHVWGLNNQSEAQMTLNIESENAGATFDASNSSQIGWAAQIGAGGTPAMTFFSLIDPDHVVVRDLILNNFGTAEGNYLVIMESISLSDDQAIMALIKERHQDDI